MCWSDRAVAGPMLRQRLRPASSSPVTIANSVRWAAHIARLVRGIFGCRVRKQPAGTGRVRVQVLTGSRPVTNSTFSGTKSGAQNGALQPRASRHDHRGSVAGRARHLSKNPRRWTELLDVQTRSNPIADGGQVADSTAEDTLLDGMPSAVILHGDKGSDRMQYVSKVVQVPPRIRRPRSIDAVRTASRPTSTVTATPSSACSDASKDFRRIATRYDRLAYNLPRGHPLSCNSALLVVSMHLESRWQP